jgi:predicted TIM-barrel fold metal-dependent hydrolase
MTMISRREWIAGTLLAAAARAARPPGVLIESHVHLVSDDAAKFPFSAGRTSRPNPVEPYVKFAVEAGISHTVIVSPEPYQDDMRYLEYAVNRGPSPGFFKGTCLFDPIDPETPKRLEALVKRNPGRIASLRIHELHPAGTPSTTTGPIRDRDLKDPRVETTWRATHDLGLSMLIQLIPHYAPQIGDLAAKFPQMPVILDHLARPGQGTAEEYEQVLKLAQIPRVYMKFSGTGVGSASKQPFPHEDAKPLVKRVYEAFGADRMIWGELGSSMAEFDRAAQLFDSMFDFAPESERAKIRGLTSQKLFAFS